MSTHTPLWAIYVDGETKTGKGAASQSIASALELAGHKVHYDVAGDFYRRFVALVREYLDLDEGDALPTGDTLLAAAQAVHATRQAYSPDSSLGNLQRSAISRSVSVLGALPIAQEAAIEWYKAAIDRARADGCDVVVIDGRNPRARVAESKFEPSDVRTILDLYMTCEPLEAARRTLIGRGIDNPTPDQLQREERHVNERRDRDRHRDDRPFVIPEPHFSFVSETMTVEEAIAASWQQAINDAPIAIKFDNSKILMQPMLDMVSAFGIAAVTYADQHLK